MSVESHIIKYYNTKFKVYLLAFFPRAFDRIISKPTVRTSNHLAPSNGIMQLYLTGPGTLCISGQAARHPYPTGGNLQGPPRKYNFLPLHTFMTRLMNSIHFEIP